MNKFKPECVIEVQQLQCALPRAPCNATACGYVKPCVSKCYSMLQACSNSNSPQEAIAAYYFLLQRTSRPTFMMVDTGNAEIPAYLAEQVKLMTQLTLLCHPALFDHDPTCDLKPPQDHEAKPFQEAAKTCGTRLTEASIAAEAAAAGAATT